MIKPFVVAIAVALCAMLLSTTVRAQADTVQASVFWDHLRQTDTLLTRTLAESDRAALLTQIQQLWTGIAHVQTGNEVINVDLQWLLKPVAAGDDSSLHAVQQQIQALLAFETQAGSIPADHSLANLQNILKDPRFQYSSPTAVPDPTLTARSPNLLNGLNFSPELSQTILLVIGTLVIGMIVIYFARSLRLRPVKLALPGLRDDPTTPDKALELAAQRAEALDFRSAIRYLYLSSLLSLNDAGMIEYNATLTNREHLLQIKGQRQLLEALRPVVDAFENVWYGYAPVDAAYYNRYYQQIQKLHAFFK